MSVGEDLEKLASLRHEGSISESEFASAKAKLLADDDSSQAPLAATAASQRPGSNRTSWGLWLTVATLVLGGLSAALFATFGAEETHYVSGEHFAQLLQDSYGDRDNPFAVDGADLEINCPSRIPIETGHNFGCTTAVTSNNPFSDGATGYLTVEIQNTDGDAFWRSDDGRSGNMNWRRIPGLQ